MHEAKDADELMSLFEKGSSTRHVSSTSTYIQAIIIRFSYRLIRKYSLLYDRDGRNLQKERREKSVRWRIVN